MAGMNMRKKNMKKRIELVKDERGQWIISAGFLVSASILILALLLNQAMMGGYQSSGAILEFPKHEIRELVQETHREVNVAAEKAWEMNDGVNTTAINLTFRNIMLNYTNSVEYLYASHGQMVYMNISSVRFNNITNKTEKVNVTILFSDGVTTCTFEPEIIEIPVVPEQVPDLLIEHLYAVNLTCDNCTINNETYAHGALNNSVATVFNVSDGDTVDATIGNTSVGLGDISSVKFWIRLNGSVGWTTKHDEIVISYSPDAGNSWCDPPAPPVNTFQPNVSSLTWYGIYTATEVNTWGDVDNMTIRITGKKKLTADDGNLSIDAYHVDVAYQEE